MEHSNVNKEEDVQQDLDQVTYSECQVMRWRGLMCRRDNLGWCVLAKTATRLS